MTITALQEAQHYADDLSLQLCLLADNAEAYSHAGTLEGTYYGLCWIQGILQRDILRTLSTNIEDCEYLMNAKQRKGLDRAEKPRKEQA